jgi:hypothetical protein
VTSIWEENWHKGETFLLEGNRKYKKTSKKQNKLRGALDSRRVLLRA